jgi:hypothetical protein
VDAAVSGDTVVIGAGIYTDWEMRTVYIGGTALVDATALVFLKGGVSLRGSGPGVTVTEPLGPIHVQSGRLSRES